MIAISEHLTEEDMEKLEHEFCEQYERTREDGLTYAQEFGVFMYEKGVHAGVCSQNRAVS